MLFFNLPDFQHENGVFPPKTAKNLESLRKFRTFALSIGTMDFERRAPKICFQA